MCLSYDPVPADMKTDKQNKCRRNTSHIRIAPDVSGCGTDRQQVNRRCFMRRKCFPATAEFNEIRFNEINLDEISLNKIISSYEM